MNKDLSTTRARSTDLPAMLQYLVFGSLVLYFGRELFIPLSLAALISFVLYPVCNWLEAKGLPRLAAIIIGLLILLILVSLLLTLLVWQLTDFLKEWPSLKLRLSTAFAGAERYFSNSLHLSQDQQVDWVAKAVDQVFSNSFVLVKQAISFSAFSLVMIILIPIYAVLILLYRKHWVSILYKIFARERKEDIRKVLLLTIEAYYNFIKGMGLVYLIVGILNSIGLALLGVPHAILFGFIASVLTFIPYVGILVGSLLPITLAWASNDSMWYPIGIISVFAFVQYLEANVIFPFAVSSRLKVNTLAILVSIFLGGILWGIAGMILFVPFAGILKLIADRSPRLVVVSMLLGDDKRSGK